MKNRLSYDESGYKGEYEYVPDKEHKNKPQGDGWYFTNNGWARGSNKKQEKIRKKFDKVQKQRYIIEQ